MTQDTEIDWTDVDTDITIELNDYVGVKCPECGTMALKRTGNGEEFCTVCSYDNRSSNHIFLSLMADLYK